MTTIKTDREIGYMREGGRMLAKILKEVLSKVEPGVTTKELDSLAESLILKAGAKPAFKGYESFPASLCASVNEEFVHMIPLDTPLKEGDIVTLDLGLIWHGLNLDMARTVGVGEIDFDKQRLIKTTKKALRLGIKKVRPDNTTGDIGNTIQRLAEDQGYGIAEGLCGHGIGKELHEDPKVLNKGKRHRGVTLKKGMVICIEPMFAIGSGELMKAKDSYGFETKDGSISAHFEDTIAVTKEGHEVLTSLE